MADGEFGLCAGGKPVALVGGLVADRCMRGDGASMPLVKKSFGG